MKRCSLLLIVAMVFMFSSCHKNSSVQQTDIDYSKVAIPSFCADSAYSYVSAQCAFGPRIPESKAHDKCASYLVAFMRQYADTVIEQDFTTKLYNGKVVRGKNIIASFNTDKTDRIVLASHWDSRLWADNDKDEANHKKPVLAANDGASGVGVLMEIARALKSKKPQGGVDLIFFDMEDQGCPTWDKTEIQDESDWCLGAQWWSRNTHVPFYQAKGGILLDMVGYKNLRFTKEEVSRTYAPTLTDKVWQIAKDRGYSNIFVNEDTPGIIDDHNHVNKNANIPMIDLVQNDATGSFFPYWHTTGDDMSQISKNSLKIVGEVCLVAIYTN